MMKAVLVFLFLTLSFQSFASNEIITEESKTESVEHLVDLMAMDHMVESIYAQMGGVVHKMRSQMRIENPDQEEILNKYAELIDDLMRNEVSWEKMQPIVVQIYEANLTKKEIDDMIAFYSTDTGRALIHKMPGLNEQSIIASQQLVGNMLPKLRVLDAQMRAEIQAFQTPK